MLFVRAPSPPNIRIVECLPSLNSAYAPVSLLSPQFVFSFDCEQRELIQYKNVAFGELENSRDEYIKK